MFININNHWKFKNSRTSPSYYDPRYTQNINRYVTLKSSAEVRVFPAAAWPARLLHSGPRELQLYSVHGAVSGQVPDTRGPDSPVDAILRVRSAVRTQLHGARLANTAARHICTDRGHRALHMVSTSWVFFMLIFEVLDVTRFV